MLTGLLWALLTLFFSWILTKKRTRDRDCKIIEEHSRAGWASGRLESKRIIREEFDVPQTFKNYIDREFTTHIGIYALPRLGITQLPLASEAIGKAAAARFYFRQYLEGRKKHPSPFTPEDVTIKIAQFIKDNDDRLAKITYDVHCLLNGNGPLNNEYERLVKMTFIYIMMQGMEFKT